ncbi:MAG: aconitase/3-isopropylmalate dehydratase large subunit family protein [Burkholderiaceae bacterium]
MSTIPTAAATSPNPAQTLAQRIIARASGRAHVAVGEIVTCAIDLAMFHDSSGPRRLAPMLDSLGARIWDPSRIVLALDHYVSADDDDSRRIVHFARRWARETGLPHVYDSQGICHVVLPEHGHLRPGMLCVGGDSHSPTGGAWGCYMFGVGATEMLSAVVTGEIWLRVPETIRYHFEGPLPDGVMAKDLMLMLLGRFGMDGGRYQAIEYSGPVITAMSMAERMTLANMGAELGAQAAMVPADDTTHEALLAAGVPAGDIDLDAGRGDPRAPASEFRFDVAALAPQIAVPHSPANSVAVDACEPEPIDIAYLGACTGAKLVDLRAAARILRGRRIARGTRLLLAPASVREREQAAREGVLAALVDAGAELLPSACGACAGYGRSIPEQSRVIASTARNFKGRMGADSARVWLGSPMTVAASALAGHLADPRAWLDG